MVFIINHSRNNTALKVAEEIPVLGLLLQMASWLTKLTITLFTWFCKKKKAQASCQHDPEEPVLPCQHRLKNLAIHTKYSFGNILIRGRHYSSEKEAMYITLTTSTLNKPSVHSVSTINHK